MSIIKSIFAILILSAGCLVSGSMGENSFESDSNLFSLGSIFLHHGEVPSTFFGGSQHTFAFMSALMQYSKDLESCLDIFFELYVPIKNFFISSKKTLIYPLMQIGMDIFGDISNAIMTGDFTSALTSLAQNYLRGFVIWYKGSNKFFEIPNIWKFVQSVEKLQRSQIAVYSMFVKMLPEILPVRGKFYDMTMRGVEMVTSGQQNIWKALCSFKKAKSVDGIVKKFKTELSKKEIFTTDPKKFLAKFKEVLNILTSNPVMNTYFYGIFEVQYGMWLFYFGLIHCLLEPLQSISPDSVKHLKVGLESWATGVEVLEPLVTPVTKIYELVGRLGPALVSAVSEESSMLLDAISRRDFESIFSLIPLISETCTKVLEKETPKLLEAVSAIASGLFEIFMGFRQLFFDEMKRMKSVGGRQETIACAIETIGIEVIHAISELISIMSEALESGNFMNARQKAYAVAERVFNTAKPFFGY